MRIQAVPIVRTRVARAAAMSMRFTDNDILDPRVTFTRADATTCATRFNSAGLLETLAANVARFDYDPATLLPRGLLIEESRTNLLLHSRDMTQAAWGKTDVTPTRNQVGIDGSANSACLMTEGSAGTALCSQGANVTAGSTVTVSVVLKRGNTDWVSVVNCNPGIVNGARAWFNLATGVKGAASAIGAGTAVSSSIQSLGGGWYRCSLTCLPDGVYTGANLLFQSANADNSTTRVNNATYIVDAAQLEVGAFATSIINTGAATATRAADSASMTGTNFSSWWNPSGGTMVCEESGVGRAYAISSGTTNEMVVQISQQPEGMIGRSAAVQTFSISTQGTLGAVNKTAAYISASNTRMSTNGSVVQTTTGALRPDLFNTFSIGSQLSAPTSEQNGWIRSIRFYNTQLPDATLRALST